MAHVITEVLYEPISVPEPRPSLMRRISTAVALRRERLALVEMDETRLDDIGMSRAEAEAEAARSFWDVPPNWRA